MENGKLKKIVRLLIVSLSIIHYPFHVFAQGYTLSKADTSDVQYLDGKKFYILKVDKSETIYSICKRFSVSQDELTKINPWLKDGLKVKSKLWVPAKSSAKVTPKAEPEKDKLAVKPQYNVALFLPLSLGNINYDFAPTDSVPTDALGKETLSALEFYEGVEYAVDSLVSKDCRIHLSTFDTNNDSLTTALLLKEWRLKDIDFIISQNTSAIQKMISKYSAEHKIPIFSFNMNASDVLKGNANAWVLQPSSNIQCEEAGKFASAHFHNSNVLLIKTNSAKESERATAFQSGWVSGASEVKTKTIDFTSLDSSLVLKALVKGKNNVVFITSSNEDVVNPLLLALISHKDDYEFTIIGLPTWQYFESIDMEVLETLNTHIFTAARHNNAMLPVFSEHFRKDYQTEPIDFALQGFDIMMLIGKSFMGKKQPEVKNYTGIFSNYSFIDSKGLHENNFISVWKYKGGELVEIR